MEEYSSKRAQAIQAKELAAKENEVRNIKNYSFSKEYKK